MPIFATNSFSNVSMSRAPGSARECKSTSSIAQAVYSIVAKPWLKVRAARSFCRSLFRQRLAGAVMPGIAAQRVRHFEPVLEDLRREFDKIAPHRRAGLRRVAHARQQAVQPM